ncbi:hypothetical protein GCM10017667_40660 [Streptomyces filamentosus]|uniref:Uncharacterized protein n=1 Tax=Streptomyces filamentosus TaxID=67294 RepID=A0A919BRV7_STRFL|nr:hypothetical protein GCM10017667_40660 [Streptomyces filamentosus]
MNPLATRVPGQALAAGTPRLPAPLQVDLFVPKPSPVHGRLARPRRPPSLPAGTEQQQEATA